jgi:AcrR family transcriptional regulator
MKEGARPAHEPWKAFQVRQRDMDAKRDAVLQTAAHMFLEQGYRKTSMSELAARLEITKPALYYYFHNKEEILVECYRAGIGDIEGLLSDALVHTGTGLDKVQAYLMAYATAVVNRDFGRCVAMLDDADLSVKARKEVHALKRRTDTALRGYVSEGIEDGSIRRVDVRMAAFAMAGAVNWIGKWYKPEGTLGAEEIARTYADLLTNGLGTGERKAN